MKGLFLLAAMLSFTTYAENKQQPVPMAPWLVAGAGGDYKFFQYNKSELQEKYLDIIQKRSKEDAAYFEKAVLDIETHFVEVLNSTVYAAGRNVTINGNIIESFEGGSLYWMNEQSRGAARYVRAVDFLRLINRYSQAIATLEARVMTLTSVAGRFPSQTRARIEDAGIGEIPAYRDIDFKPLTAFYKTKTEEMTAGLKNLQHFIIVANGTEYITPVGKGLELGRVGTLLPKEEIQRLRDKITKARTWTRSEEKAVDSYTSNIRLLTSAFIDTYGREQRYRSLSEADKAKRGEDAKFLVEAFFTRSWIRTIYGMPIGAIGLDYSRSPFHIEVITKSTKSLALFHEEVMWKERQFILQEQNYRDALRRVKVRSQDVDFSNIMDGDLGFVATAENILTWLGGQRNLAKSLEMVLFLLAADTYEERLIQRAGGLDKMKGRFRARYASTPADKEFYTKIANEYDPRGNAVQGGGLTDDSVYGKFTAVRNLIRTKQDELGNMELVQATLDSATGDNAFSRASDERRDNAFGP